MAAKRNPPKFYRKLKKTQPEFLAAWESVGKAVRGKGPIDLKTAHLVQLAAATAIRSEGAVHSHVRRAIEAGASPAEVRQAIMLIAATVGFPNVVAALSWAEDVLGD
jgi:alkylhydroperoxidase/carboxymuconolactone decarboxylase family protein YurZ